MKDTFLTGRLLEEVNIVKILSLLPNLIFFLWLLLDSFAFLCKI